MRLDSFLRAGSGSVISQAITFACLPILFRLYTPADFAPWAIALAVVTVVGGVATLRYELAVVVERDNLDASALFWVTLFLALVIGGVAGSIFVFLPSFGTIFPGAQTIMLGPMMAVWVILIAFIQALQGWALHRGAFLEISLAQVSNAVALNAVQLVGGYVGGGGARWLILGSIIGQMLYVIVLLRGTLRSVSAPASFATCKGRIRSLLKRHRKFPLFLTPYTLCSILRERVAVIILGVWTNTMTVGLYSQAWRLMSFPVGLSGAAVRPVLFHAAAEQGLAAQESRVNRILLTLIVIGTPWLAIILYKPEDLFGMVLGDHWRDAGSYAAILAVPLFLFTLRNWMDRILDLAGKQEINLLTEIIVVTTSIGGLLIALAMGESVLVAVSIQSIFLAINYALFIVIAYRVAGYQIRILFWLAILCVALVCVFTLLLYAVGHWASTTKVLVIACIFSSIFSAMSGWYLLKGIR